MYTIFNYQSVADEFGIPQSIVNKIVEEIRKEIPNDDMIMELHILRALKFYANKHNLLINNENSAHGVNCKFDGKCYAC